MHVTPVDHAAAVVAPENLLASLLVAPDLVAEVFQKRKKNTETR